MSRFFLAPPLVFWLLDKSLRFLRTRAVPLLAIDCGCGNVTRLVLPARALSTWTSELQNGSGNGGSENGGELTNGGGTTHHYAGQWVWYDAGRALSQRHLKLKIVALAMR
jgi:hypothetical protein